MNLHHEITPREVLKVARTEAQDGPRRDDGPSPFTPAELRAELLAGILGIALLLGGSWFACAAWFGR